MKQWNLLPGTRFNDLTIPENAIYVDSENGNDTTGEGNMESPYRTLVQARTGQRSSYIVCRGYFDETLSTLAGTAYVIADTLYGATYAGNLTMANSGQIHYFNWLFYYNATYYENSRSSSHDYCWCINKEDGKCFAVVPVEETTNKYFRIGSFYRQDFVMNAPTSSGYYADRACAEKCSVRIYTTNSYSQMDYSVFKDCTFYINTETEPLELSGTDEEQTTQLIEILSALKPAYGYEHIKITSGPLFNDPEKGDLTIHPDSVLLNNKIYKDSVNYFYPCAFPPALNIKMRPDSQGEKNAFDETSVSGGLFITDNGCLELQRDGAGMPIEGGLIDTKVITLDKKFTLGGINVVLENDELNAGVHLGNIRKTVKVRVKNNVEKMVYSWALEEGATYMNLENNVDIKNEETGVVRKLFINESFVKRSNETIDSVHGSRFGLLFSAEEEGWMDCPADTDLLVKKVGDVKAGKPDTGTDGNILTNAHPEFYSEENKTRPDFYITAKYVQYRVIVTI
ncbi:MAG: hypothetical protein LUG18_15280 [Candidatus Azobacteroides sp.]|nr:hypothetical protein [Candidatus Azobacteroides sp.]